MPEKKTRNIQIGHRISAYILLIGILSILVTSTIFFYLEYKRNIKEIYDRINELSHTAVENLSRSTWEVDRGKIQDNLENLSSVPGIRHVALHSPELGDFSAGVSSPQNSVLTYPLSIRRNDKEIQLGSLFIQTSRDDAMDKTIHHLPAIIATQTASILLITLLLSYIIRRMLVRHLATMADYVRKLEIMNTDAQLRLDRGKKETHDELDDVEEAINSMRANLHASYHDLHQANRLLEQDIAKRKEIEQAREHLLLELREALAKVKLLSGFLPICASCKKIRDDKGYWNQIEEYIRDHSEADFSHGICPDCIEKLYPDFYDRINSSQ